MATPRAASHSMDVAGVSLGLQGDLGEGLGSLLTLCVRA